MFLRCLGQYACAEGGRKNVSRRKSLSARKLARSQSTHADIDDNVVANARDIASPVRVPAEKIGDTASAGMPA